MMLVFLIIAIVIFKLHVYIPYISGLYMLPMVYLLRYMLTDVHILFLQPILDGSSDPSPSSVDASIE